MIHVNRHRLDDEGNLIQPNQAWFQSAQDATNTVIQDKGAHQADRAV